MSTLDKQFLDQWRPALVASLLAGVMPVMGCRQSIPQSAEL